MPLSGMKVEEIDNRAAHHPVQRVAGRAADDHADRHRRQAGGKAPQPDQPPDDDDRRQHHQNDLADMGIVVEHAKADAAIHGQHQVEEPGNHDMMLGLGMRREIAKDAPFGELIDDGDDHRDDDAAHQHQAARSSASAQRSHRSSCPGWCPTSGSTRQQRWHLSPGAGPTTTATFGTSARVKASAGAAPKISIALETMHNSARSTPASAPRYSSPA